LNTTQDTITNRSKGDPRTIVKRCADMVPSVSPQTRRPYL
jgi:hypothetical protein